MGTIKQLPKQISDKIAAGEVVSAPLSVVKELVENSIDAGANQISVEIEGGGKTYIRVTDDGSGIPSDDVGLAFSPHATSKIAEESDLDSISTLGFRGEALSSIAAVTRLEMITKTSEEKTAWRIMIEGGEVMDEGPTGAPDGTSITVRDMFYNTPARLKFMKSDRSETAKIVDLMSRIAVAYPERKIRISVNGTVMFSTPGKGDRLQTILTVFGVSAGEDLISLEYPDTDAGHPLGFRLRAWISDPNHSAKTRRNQVFFVNGRYVKDDIISGAVADAYKEFMFEGRYPLVYLFLETDPSFVDVNVHPAKSEIKFADSASVRGFVKDAIVSALMSKAGVPKAHTAQQFAAAKRAEREFYKFMPEADSGAETASTELQDTSDSGDESVSTVKISRLWNNEPDGGDEYSESMPRPTGAVREQDGGNEYQKSVGVGRVSSSADAASERSASPQQEFRIDYLQTLGSVFGSYIVAADKDSLYLVDWHAAHERVNYEKFMESYRSGEKLSQELLSPEVLPLPAAARPYTDDWAVWLSDAGYTAEIFGDGSLIIKSVPAFLDSGEAIRFAHDIIESGGNAPPDNERAVERLISRACRSSVKANTKIRDEEADALLMSLSKCNNPYTCPHGRPVFIRYTKYDIEKLFKRV